MSDTPARRSTLMVAAFGFALVLVAWLVVWSGYRSGFFVPPFYRFLREDLRAVWPQLASGVCGVFFAFALPKLRVDGSFAAIAEYPRLAAAVSVAVCLAISVSAYQSVPLAMDEVAPLFQARVFASGRLAAQFVPSELPRLFAPGFLGVFYFFEAATGRIVSAYWPGMALLLAPFEALHAGFLLNPLLAGASVLLLRYVALTLTNGDRAASGLGMALLMVSPAFVINASSFYSMNAHVTANLAFVALSLVPTTARLVAAGAVGGLALSLNNPLPHLLFAWPWWLLLLHDGARVRKLVALLAGYVPVALVLVVGWFWFSNGLRGPGASPIGGTAVAHPSLSLLKVRAEGLSKLVLWLPFAALPLAVLGAWRHAAKWPVRALVLSALGMLLAYFGVSFDQGHGWGYRYFHPALGCVPLLGALAVVSAGAERGRAALLRACAGWCLAGACLLLPGRAFEVARVVSAHRAQLLTAPTGRDCVHFVRASGVSSADLIDNDPELRGELFLFNASEADVEAFRARHLRDTRAAGRSSTDQLFCGDLRPYRAFALGRGGRP